MNTIPQNFEDKLLDYVDGKLSMAENQAIETMAGHDKELQARIEELRALNSMMRHVKLERPSVNFTHRVMDRLQQKPSPSFSIRNGILLLTGALVIIGMALVLASAGVFDNTSTAIDLNKIDLPKKYFDYQLPTFSLDGKTMVNIIVILNIALVFVVLDRAILKPIFKRRIQASH